MLSETFEGHTSFFLLRSKLATVVGRVLHRRRRHNPMVHRRCHSVQRYLNGTSSLYSQLSHCKLKSKTFKIAEVEVMWDIFGRSPFLVPFKYNLLKE